MEKQRRHDSVAPKGAFGGNDTTESELAAAQTATLVASGAAWSPAPASTLSDDDEAEISISTLDHGEAVDDELCADELIPVMSAEQVARVSVEDAMRALIELRLERSRPSDDFGAFELSPAVHAHDHRASAGATAQPSEGAAPHSLAPIELTRVAPAVRTTVATQKLGPLPLLAAAAVLLLGVGVYRRANRQAPTRAPQTHAAAQLPTAPARLPPTTFVATPPAPALHTEQLAAAETEVLDVSESDYAILTLGSPTIVNVPSVRAVAKPNIRTIARAAKAADLKDALVAEVPVAEVAVAEAAPKEEAVAPERPDAPSREAILAGFNSVREGVLACAHGNGGVAPIEATIVGDGHVTHATVGGYYQGTPEGSCIARTLRSARFEPFARESIKVAFPYTL